MAELLMRSGETQTAFVRRTLKEHGRIDTYDALYNVRLPDGRKRSITRLAAIVFNLRHKDGMDILTVEPPGKLASFIVAGHPSAKEARDVTPDDNELLPGPVHRTVEDDDRKYAGSLPRPYSERVHRVTNIGPDQQEDAKRLAREHARAVAGLPPEKDITHFVGDDCAPDGHRSDGSAVLAVVREEALMAEAAASVALDHSPEAVAVTRKPVAWECSRCKTRPHFEPQATVVSGMATGKCPNSDCPTRRTRNGYPGGKGLTTFVRV